MARPDAVRRHIFYAGRVQGVGFRYTTRSVAGRFDVSGFVRNLPDGRVELVVEGATAEVAAFVQELESEMSAYIRQRTENRLPATGEYAGFEIAH